MLKLWLVWPILAAVTLTCGFLLLVAGSMVAEAALHPRVLPVPLVCPVIAGTQCANVEIHAADGTRLRGWYFRPLVSSGRVVIVLHGIAASREQVVRLAEVFLPSGYSILVPDMRGHGESGGMVTFGVHEADDVHAWADWLFDSEHVSWLYGMGESLGGAVLLQSLRLETRFKAVIAESSYSDFPSIAQERIGRMLPPGVRWLTGPIVFFGLVWTNWRYGIDLNKTSSSAAVRETRVPVLLIHGLADNETSPGSSRRIAAGNPLAELWLVPRAGHIGAWIAAPNEFESRIHDWFERH